MHEVVIGTRFSHRFETPVCRGGACQLQNLLVVIVEYAIGGFAAKGLATNLYKFGGHL